MPLQRAQLAQFNYDPPCPARRPPSKSDTTRHSEALRTSSALTDIYRRMYQREAAMISPEAVIQTLNEAEVRFVVMGTHGVGGWRDQPRATQDVDILVQKRYHRKAMAAIRQAFPDLTVQDTPVVTRFIDPHTNKPVIDLMKPSAPLLQRAFRNTILVSNSHRVPNLEMALALKFAAMISPNRPHDKKLIDGGDFTNIVRHNDSDIDLDKLRRLADLVYDGGGEEVLRMVEDIRAGRILQL
jgi:hypothetical protein